MHLKELLEARQPLLCVYVLCDELKRLWFYCKPAWAQNAWEKSIRQPAHSAHHGFSAVRPAPVRLFGILARRRQPLNTSVVKGINNTIKVIKRRAYGYRDEEYFFLNKSAPRSP